MSSGFRTVCLLPCVAFLTALGLLASPLRIQAGNAERFAGWGSDGKVTAKFSAGAAQWDAKNRRVSIGFAPAPLAAADRDVFLQFAWWADSMKRVMSLHMEFGPGQDAASLRGLRGYSVMFYHYPAYPHETPVSLHFGAGDGGAATDSSAAFRGWGWQQLLGDLRPGGRIRGHVAFSDVYENKNAHIGPIHYRWDLEFDAVMP